MSGWVTVGLGAAALCPLPGLSVTAVVADHMSVAVRVVMCAPGVSAESGPARPDAVLPPPATAPAPSAPASPAPAGPEPTAPHRPASRAPRLAATVAPPSASATPTPEPPPVHRAAPARPAPPKADAPAPRKAAAFRWVPRRHYTGGVRRPAPAGLSTVTTMTVITTPAVLAAAALRPGSRRRSRG
ncbi:hypothetical protein [Streptomyces chryseus]